MEKFGPRQKMCPRLLLTYHNRMEMECMDKLKSLRKNVIAGNVAKSSLICRQLLEEEVPPQTILQEVLLPSMSELSSHYDSEKIYIPQLLLCSKTLNECLKILKEAIGDEAEEASKIKVVIGTIKGDIHSIGKNIVAYLLETYGFTTIDLGTNVSGRKFIDAVYKYDAQCIVISAMLTSTLVYVKDAVDEINNEKFKNKPYIIIGGALITEDFAREIGVDYGFSAIDTVNKVKEQFEVDL